MHRSIGIAVLAVVLVGGFGLAFAQKDEDSPRLDLVTAKLEASRSRIIGEKFCRGADGHYRQANDEYKGTIKSADPRLEGNIVVAGPQLINLKTGFGVNRSHVTVTDDSGKVTARLQITAILGPQRSIGNGVVTGDLPAEGDLPAGRIYANYRGFANFKAGKIGADIGTGNTGAVRGQDTAVINTGDCGLEGEGLKDAGGADR